MKNKFGILPLFGLLVLGSCSPDPDPISGIMNCDIDGDYWESTSAAAVIGNGMINVTGQITSTGETITLTLQGTSATTYNLVVSGQHAAAYVPETGSSSSYTSNYSGGSGAVTVTEINTSAHTVTGVFNFTGVKALDGSVVEITNGYFTDIPYTEEVNQTFDNIFTAKVDGVTFNPTLISGSLSMGKIAIVGSENGSFPSIGIYVPDNVAAGTYSFSPYGSYNALYNAGSSTNQMYSAASGSGGTVTITSHNTTDNIIIGTFAFTATPNVGSTATDSHAITNGTFEIKY